MTDATRTKPDAPTLPNYDDARTFAVLVARMLADDKLEDVVIIDLRGLTGVADFFVVGTGTAERQMRASLEHLRLHAKTISRRPLSIADSESGVWLLADFVDVVVHLFGRDQRAYYDLDGLWGDAPRVPWDTAAAD